MTPAFSLASDFTLTDSGQNQTFISRQRGSLNGT
jgi:hypothetical protein